MSQWDLSETSVRPQWVERKRSNRNVNYNASIYAMLRSLLRSLFAFEILYLYTCSICLSASFLVSSAALLSFCNILSFLSKAKACSCKVSLISQNSLLFIDFSCFNFSCFNSNCLFCSAISLVSSVIKIEKIDVEMKKVNL